MTTPEGFETPRHPIGVVAERTRLSQDVLRVWERRYGVVQPGRGATGQRLYSDADIERLRLLGIATQGGRGIGQIARLTAGELAGLVEEDEAARALPRAGDRVEDEAEEFIGPAMAHVRALDGRALDSLLRRASARTGLAGFFDGVVTPLLHRIGEEWHAGRLAPAEEHLATAVVQRVVSSSIESIGAAPGAPNLVVATLAGERHELGAILAAAIAAADGWRVTYLGPDLPVADIADAAHRTGAAAVGVSVIYPTDRAAVVASLTDLRDRLSSGVALLVGGGGARSLDGSLNRLGIEVVGELRELQLALRAAREAASA